MNKKHKLTIFIILLSIVLSACGAQGTPTINPADVQTTAIAAAFTVVAQTQAAIPTNTPIPPTETPTATPQPTETPVILVTETGLLPTLTATVQASGGGDPCNQALKSNPAGHPTKILLANKTNAPITASLYLNITPFGECGYRGYNLAANDSILITDLTTGCYNVGVFVNHPRTPSKAFGYGCINNPDKWTFEVYADFVKFFGP